ncbi:hypothetical protein [Glycomyces buryatensis]|uniref:Phage head morphogenesis domain-containing protein n=1 Tax=Glycomyces buryatensis TaxID=2570927 RepID=A0A4S8Q9Y3_9ACTN|nr:hypothetical protein [Glycomyces buryatensis]THV39622.1 hypothetical protein FAB82_17275 [Glycomyces buryatensis]
MTTAVEDLETEFARRIEREGAAAQLDLIDVWPLLDTRDLDASFPSYATAAQLVIGEHSGAMIAAADQYLAQLRDLAGVEDLADLARTVGMSIDELLEHLLMSGPVTIKTGLQAGWTLERAVELALVESLGTIQKILADLARERTFEHLQAEYNAGRTARWARFSISKRPCPWCRMQISRGPVFYTERTASFKSHKHCKCLARVIYQGTPLQRDREAEYLAEWKASGGDLNAMRRADYAAAKSED